MNQSIPWNIKEEIHFADKRTCSSGGKNTIFSTTKKLFGAAVVEL